MALTALEPAEPGLLVAEPLVRTEIKIGYARVSTSGQKLERHLDALTAAGWAMSECPAKLHLGV